MVDIHRNPSETHIIGGEKIFSKKLAKPIFLRRELFFYSLLNERGLVKTPKLYGVEDLTLKTYFIDTEKRDILQAAKEWAKVHSYFLQNSIKDEKFLMHHTPQDVAAYLLANSQEIEKYSRIIETRLQEIVMEEDMETVLHGDLQKNNFFTVNGLNYYFDFEFGGFGHPGRDVASMIISEPNKKREIVLTYKDNFEYDYPHLNEDIDKWVLLRTLQLYFIFKRKKLLPRKIERKLSDIIEGFE